MPSHSALQWFTFGIVVAAALVADVLLFHRKAHEVGWKEALVEGAGWIGLALLFNGWIYWTRGPEAGLEFLTAYVVEKSLSVDNILVFILIFSSLKVPTELHHKVLFYGVFGALLMRGLFVLAGIELLHKFHVMLYLLGAILLVTGARMLLPGRRALDPERNWLVGWARRVFPLVDRYEGDKLLVKINGEWKVTSLVLVLVAVEATDIVFSLDSVPAVLAITREPFLAYASNAFAILGLRALYFTLSGALTRLRYLHQGLAVLLLFVAIKMVAGEWLPISTGVSLAVVGVTITLTVVISLVRQRTPEGR